MSKKGLRTVKRHIAKMPHIRYVGSGYSGHWEVLDKEQSLRCGLDRDSNDIGLLSSTIDQIKEQFRLELLFDLLIDHSAVLLAWLCPLQLQRLRW